MALEGLFYTVSDLFDVRYLELSIDYAGKIESDARKLLLV
jgi:hypothetical protein